MLCLAPLVLVGYLFTLQTSSHHSTMMNGAQIDVQTCESGLGLHAKATTSGLYSTGLHYGLTGEWGNYSVTLQPRVGFSVADRPVYELPSQVQFELGQQLILGYGDFRLAVEYWHLSNAYTKAPNIGMDFIILSSGWRF